VSWRAVAHKDVHDASRSKTIWVLFVLLGLLTVGYAVVHEFLGPEEPTFLTFLGGLAGLVGTVLPVLALLLGYKSVIEARTSGSMFLTLSLPHSRRDVVTGTVLGRTVVLLAPTLAGLVVAGVAGVVLYGTEGALLYPWFMFAVALYGLAFVGLAVGLSMWTTGDRWVTFGALGGYLLLVTFWSSLHSLTMLFLHRFNLSVLSDLPDWSLLFRLLGPGEAFDRLLRAGFDLELAGRYVAEDAPLYVDWWMALLILAAWCVVPLALGFRRFGAADL